MTHKSPDAIKRANDAILAKMAGMRVQPATPESIADPRNPNAVIPPCDVEHSSADSNTQSGRAPPCTSPVRLVWRAPSRE
jgi:hypothetical protein